MATPAQINRLAARHQTQRRSLVSRTAAAVGRMWSAVDAGSIAASWARLTPNAQELVQRSQQAAAEEADPYLLALLELYGIRPGSPPQVDPAQFATGYASDGRDLTTLLYQPVVTALRAIRGGASPVRALASGRLALDRIVRTQVADAGRVADGVALVARPQLSGWVRMVNLPACSRCLILAGRFYRWDDGFQRHDLCDCTHIPAAEAIAGDLTLDPRKAFEAMTREQQDASFGKNAAQAVRDGADMNRVVNAGRSTYVAGGIRYTRDATTRRGTGRKVRLAPEGIYKIANGDRDEALRLLRFHGYLT